jgi:hypothetical protein
VGISCLINVDPPRRSTGDPRRSTDGAGDFAEQPALARAPQTPRSPLGKDLLSPRRSVTWVGDPQLGFREELSPAGDPDSAS